LSPFTGAELDQMDRAAEAQAQREAFAASHPEWRSQPLHPIFADLLKAHACVPAVADALARAAEKARDRRFTAEPITGFGALEQLP